MIQDKRDHMMNRMREIVAAVSIYLREDKEVPQTWLDELSNLNYLVKEEVCL